MNFMQDYVGNNMNRIKIKLDDFLSIENLLTAFYDCKRSKRSKRETLYFEFNLGKEISKLYRELKDGTYKRSIYCCFYVYEPKERLILQPKLRDLVVQRLIYNAIYDEVDKRLFYHSYGVRKERGMHKASKLAQRFMKSSDKEKYYLQLDIRKFFFSISREKFKEMLDYFFKDTKLKELMFNFIGEEGGIAIGNLLSGIFGMMFLSRLDFYIKHKLGIKKYIRFMDDFVIFDVDKDYALKLKEQIEEYIKQFGLSFSKTRIQKIKSGINFIGFRTFQHYRLIRKRSIKNFKKAVKTNNISSKTSILGHALGTSSYKYLKEYERIYNEIL